MTDDDLRKPLVRIASMWYEGNTCNMHLDKLAARVKEGVDAVGLYGMRFKKRQAFHATIEFYVDAVGLYGMRFNTIGVSDGIAMGTEGMSYSLLSKDLIADSIETVMCAHWYDANISIPGCDKNMPESIIAMARVNRPSLMVYGGTIRAGCRGPEKLDIVSAFQSYGQFIVGEIDEEERQEIVKRSCPGPGACGGMYTANTTASAIEAMGMSLPYSSSTPAEDPMKLGECFRAGEAIHNLLEMDLKPSDIITRDALENAISLLMALGGSTNAVLHILAIARAAKVPLSIHDFQEISDRVPLLADLKPSGKYVMEDLHNVGGTPAVMKYLLYLLENGILNGQCMTVTGMTVAENLEHVPGLARGQDVILPLERPLKKSGHIQILAGTLAPGGAVAKIAGKEGERFSGPARVFDSEELMLAALEEKRIHEGDVVVIRYEGPKGGPGMPEMLTPTSAIVGAGLGKHLALVTDGRFSGGSHGFIVGHVTPEAQEGGPIALVEDGDTITIDAVKRSIDIKITSEELARRKRLWQAPRYKATRGVL